MEQVVEQTKSRQRHRSASEWRELLEAWRSSGKTREVWCREHGVGQESLRGWIKRLGKTDSNAQLVELRRDATPQAELVGHVRILANGDVELVGEFSDEVLRRVLRVVREAVDVS